MPKKGSSSGGATTETSAGSAEDRLLARLRQLERENVALKVEGEFCKERLKASDEGRHNFAESTRLLQHELTATKADASDVLEHAQRELRSNAALVKKYETDIRSLREAFQESERQLKQLREEQALSQIKGEHLVKVTEAKDALRETVCQQDSVIAKQCEELKRIYAQLESVQLRNRAMREENMHLRFRAATTTSLRVFFQKPWLVTRSRHKCVGADVLMAASSSGIDVVNALGVSASAGGGAHDAGTDTGTSDVLHGSSGSASGGQLTTNAVPHDRDNSTLVQLGQKHVVYFGGGGGGGGSVGGGIHSHAVGGQRTSIIAAADEAQKVYTLSLDDFTWTSASSLGGEAGVIGARHGHSTTAMTKSKLAVIGGAQTLSSVSAMRRPQTNVLTFNTDTMRWQEHNLRSTGTGFLPRECHAAACLREKMYVFGGVVSGMLVNDICHLDFESMQVTHHSPSTALVPTPRHSATLSSSEVDVRRLIVFGGIDVDGVALNDTFVFEIDKSAWFKPRINGAAPRARARHVAQVTDKYLMVHGGFASDGSRLTDTWILDTDVWEWECVHDSASAHGTANASVAHHHHAGSNAAASIPSPSNHAAAVALKPRGSYSTICNNRLYILHPSFDEKLDEMEVIEFGFPEEILAMMQTRQRHSSKLGRVDNVYLDHLHLSDEAVTTLTSIEVRWEPPTKNADRIAGYKLMLATNTGAVKEIFHGNVRRFKATNLSPNSEYCFCVKALYEDGTHVWSECKAFVTAYHGGGNGPLSAACTGRAIKSKNTSSTHRRM